MTDEQFRALLDLWMVSDPWPLAEWQSDTLLNLLTDESKGRGFDGWVEAYHRHMKVTT